MKQALLLSISAAVIWLLELILFSKIPMFPLGALTIYPLFLFRLPLGLPKGAYLFLGFCFGLLLDVFLHTGGLHAASASALCFFRPSLLTLLFSKEELETIQRPSFQSMGFGKFFFSLLVLVLIHQLFFYTYAYFRFDLLGNLALRWISSSLLSIGLMVLFHALFARK